jgi:hypothetical protein
MSSRSILHIDPVLPAPVARNSPPSTGFSTMLAARDQDYRGIRADVKCLSKDFFKQHALGKSSRPPVHYGYHRVNIDGVN